MSAVATTRSAALAAPAAKAAPRVRRKPAARPAAKSKAQGKGVAVPKPAAKVAKRPAAARSEKKAKPKKDRLIRDGFTIPESEYDLIAAIKKRCLAKGMAVKKSEVLRAAIISFAAMSDSKVTAAL